VIEVPAKLNSEQAEAVEDLARVLNGNPRERLIREARAAMGDAA
jgi:molecular chaperone DnaJ